MRRIQRIAFGAVISVLTAVCYQNGYSQGKASKWPHGITYEIFVQAFADSDGDGIGDIPGMTSKLDYLQSLGVEGIWLMPINPSPSYHKYDVTDYYDIHPDYGTLDDFKTFISEAHRRSIKVVMDLVINHSSAQHPWFKEARSNSNSRYRDYFVWTHKDDPQTWKEGRIIAGDSDNQNRWNKEEGSDYLFYSYFGGHMPDLNFDNPRLREEIFRIGRFWLSEVGVDGFRLDAARHIFPDERPQDNHHWWVYFRNEMQKIKPDVYLVGEVWAPAEIVGPYMHGLPALFNFDMSAAITHALNTEKADSLLIIHKNIRAFYESVNPAYIDATFLSNHDQNRMMSALGNHPQKAKLAAAILLTLPGSPYLYYGEEIGMKGMKPDEHIREPFLWDVVAKDKQRSEWIKPRFSTDSSVVPLSKQMKDKNSLYAHYRGLIQLRNHSEALTSGNIEEVSTGLPGVCAFKRVAGAESLLIVHNISGTTQRISLPPSLNGYKNIVFKSNNPLFKGGTLTLPAYTSVVLGR